MRKTFSIDRGNRIYYCGYISKYEETEEQKKHKRYMIFQKTVGVTAVILGIIFAVFGAGEALLLSLVGSWVALTDQRVLNV